MFHIELNTQNPNTIVKMTIYYTNYPLKCQNTFNKLEMFGKVREVVCSKLLFYYIYKFHNSYFVIFGYFVNFIILGFLHFVYVHRWHWPAPAPSATSREPRRGSTKTYADASSPTSQDSYGLERQRGGGDVTDTSAAASASTWRCSPSSSTLSRIFSMKSLIP